jgi:LuxR family transcriptional regulator of csgAB operon
MNLKARDISSHGIFLETDCPLPLGSKVKIELCECESHTDGENGGKECEKSSFEAFGKVIRVEDDGMAIVFQQDSGDEICPPAENVHLWTIGPNLIQNSLLNMYLENRIGLKCRGNAKGLQEAMVPNESKAAERILFLINWTEDVVVELSNQAEFHRLKEKEGFWFAIINLKNGACEEKELIGMGIHGIFHDEDSLELLAEGILAILKGELWYSKKGLSEFVAAERRRNRCAGATIPEEVLTAREGEVLHKIFLGKSNFEISEDLCISFHTVKTHVRNIFKKIGVSNRSQAAYWARSYFRRIPVKD